MAKNPRLLYLAPASPFPRKSGFQQRFYYMLKAVKEQFHVTYVAPAHSRDFQQERQNLEGLCDEVLLLEALYSRNTWSWVRHKILAEAYSLFTGLKTSNYVIGRLEFSPHRLAKVLQSRAFDCVLFQYWHAVESVSLFRARGIPCFLDMHDILWQSYAVLLKDRRWIPGIWKDWALAQYKQREEWAWTQFDTVIAFNLAEMDYVREQVPKSVQVLYAPMGTNLTEWPYSWKTSHHPRVAYYGALGSRHNQRDAMRCFESIMPRIWNTMPEVEFWFVGSQTPAFIAALAADPRVHVTGYIEHPAEVLGTMTLILCPWSGGTHGFRSRLIEAMALGVPVIANQDAVYGMGMEPGRGIFIEESDDDFAAMALKLLSDPNLACEQSRLAREQVEEKFSFEATYGQCARQMREMIQCVE